MAICLSDIPVSRTKHQRLYIDISDDPVNIIEISTYVFFY